MRRGGLAVFLVGLACATPPVDDGRKPPPPECLALESPFERYECLVPYIEDLTETEGARFAVCRAATLQADGVVDDCHALAHVIGNHAYEITGDAGEAFAACGSACVEGCLHGVMEVFVGSLPHDMAAVTEAVAPLCDDVGDADWYACVHGVGHGLRFHNLFAMPDALAICDAAGDEHWADVCAGGVYMEQVDIALAPGLVDLALVLPTICADLDGDPRQEHCNEAIGEGLMFRTAHDLDQSLDLCLRLAASDAIAACQHGAEAEGELNAQPDDNGCGG